MLAIAVCAVERAEKERGHVNARDRDYLVRAVHDVCVIRAVCVRACVAGSRAGTRAGNKHVLQINSVRACHARMRVPLACHCVCVCVCVLCVVWVCDLLVLLCTHTHKLCEFLARTFQRFFDLRHSLHDFVLQLYR